ncbi:MAG: uracil-DNA glycosylase [Treponema sp.]|nr:uracil-DNA glycosylase [Treponema sp.]
MTPAEKRELLGFLHLTADLLQGGHRRDREIPDFPGEVPGEEAAAQQAEMPGPGTAVQQAVAPQPEAPPLPLAYQIDEGDFPESLAASCRLCKIAGTQKVWGEGASEPLVLVIGEAPGAEEEASGRPFVGPAGQLLDRMLASIDLSRLSNAYIANILKCRPPHNRDPIPEEIRACLPFLEGQIEALQPRMILSLGRVASQALLKTGENLVSLRGKLHSLRLGEKSYPVLCSYHPSAILRDQDLRRPAWEDLKALRELLAAPSDPGQAAPGRGI